MMAYITAAFMLGNSSDTSWMRIVYMHINRASSEFHLIY
jgi:hypothetical protein